MPQVIKSFLLLPSLALGWIGLHPSIAEALPPIPERHYPPQQPIARDSREGGGSRGCPTEINPMIAILPKAYQNGGLTQTEQPTLWIHLPFDVIDDDDNVKAILLTVRNADSNESDYIFQEVFRDINLRHGLVGLPLTSSDFVLPLNQTLEWSLSLYCDAWDDFPHYTVHGWIARVEESDLTQPIPVSGSVAGLSHAYINNGLWYDAFSVLAAALEEEPTSSSIRSEVQQILLEGGLDSIPDETPFQYLPFSD